MRPFVAAALLAVAPVALACGYCVEDKIAAAYDHAVVARAMTQKHHVAFFHVEGPGASARLIEQLAQSAPGVDQRSARVSPDAATLAVAYDPARTSFAAVHAALEKRLSGMRVSLMPLQVMERPGGLRSVQATKAPPR